MMMRLKSMNIGVPPDSSIREVARVMACMNIRKVTATESGKVIRMFKFQIWLHLDCERR
jgi:hypothetical protein